MHVYIMITLNFLVCIYSSTTFGRTLPTAPLIICWNCCLRCLIFWPISSLQMAWYLWSGLNKRPPRNFKTNQTANTDSAIWYARFCNCVHLDFKSGLHVDFKSCLIPFMWSQMESKFAHFRQNRSFAVWTCHDSTHVNRPSFPIILACPGAQIRRTLLFCATSLILST